MTNLIDLPERFNGMTPADSNNQIYSYLWRMVEQLNVALEQVDKVATFNAEATNTLKAESNAEITQSANQLKSLIIKNAESIIEEMDSMILELEGKYVATSDFGTYVENTSSRITATAESVTQQYQFISEIDANVNTLSQEVNNNVQTMQVTIDDVVQQFTTFRNETSAYIKSGIVDYNGADPIYGIAVGQDLITSINNGETVVEKQKFRSVFTATKLGFWQDATEVAYLENNKLYIPQVQILGTLIHGAFKITADGTYGYSIKWQGET
jgi:hypothetical protein